MQSSTSVLVHQASPRPSALWMQRYRSLQPVLVFSDKQQLGCTVSGCSLLLTAWTEATRLACWRSFCRVLVELLSSRCSRLTGHGPYGWTPGVYASSLAERQAAWAGHQSSSHPPLRNYEWMNFSNEIKESKPTQEEKDRKLPADSKGRDVHID